MFPSSISNKIASPTVWNFMGDNLMKLQINKTVQILFSANSIKEKKDGFDLCIGS